MRKRYHLVSLDITLTEIVTHHAPSLPLPASGKTGVRFAALSSWSAQDLSLGRLVEGHVDALAILAEAQAQPVKAGSSYGVWAARNGTGTTKARRNGAGWWCLSGRKPFCSGSGLIDRALVTAETEDGYRLFDIALAENVVGVGVGSWQAVGMADSVSDTLEFGGSPIPPERAIGDPGFYLDRLGFWFGAIGVAACWYGGALGLVDNLIASLPQSPPDVITAELGRAVAHVRSMRNLLDHAAAAIDSDPEGAQVRGRELALSVRYSVHHSSTQVLGHVAAAGGARPLCHDRTQAQRAADLYVYLAQHHGPLDAMELGRLALSGAR